MCLLFEEGLVAKDSWMHRVTEYDTGVSPITAAIFQSFLCVDADSVVGVTPPDKKGGFRTFCTYWDVLCSSTNAPAKPPKLRSQRCEPQGKAVWLDVDSVDWSGLVDTDFIQEAGGLCSTSCGMRDLPFFEQVVSDNIIRQVDDVCGGSKKLQNVSLTVGGSHVSRKVQAIGAFSRDWLVEVGRSVSNGRTKYSFRAVSTAWKR